MKLDELLDQQPPDVRAEIEAIASEAGTWDADWEVLLTAGKRNARLRDGLKSAEHFLSNATQYIGVINDHDMPKALHALAAVRAALG